MSSQEKIAPCAFNCPESKASIEGEYPNFYGRCQYCGSRGPQETSHERALAAWNRRAPSEREKDVLSSGKALLAAHKKLSAHADPTTVEGDLDSEDFKTALNAHLAALGDA